MVNNQNESDPNEAREVKTSSRGWKLVLLLSSLAALGLMAAAAITENVGFDWRSHQREYRDAVIARSTGKMAETAAKMDISLKQIVIPKLDRLDRCIVCHAGIDDPNMAEAAQPLRAHSGTWLKSHPSEKFGCTVCHDGQGRALKKEDAHGQMKHWLQPRTIGDQIYTACARCHYENDLYGTETLQFARGVTASPITKEGLAATLPGSESITRGKKLILSLGCLGCHKHRNRGGSLGPDITLIGDKLPHDFDFSHIEGERTVRQWLIEHFKRPGEVSPDTLMPASEIDDGQIEDLANYMLSLRAKSVPPSYMPAHPVGQTPASGKTLYAVFCSACHGQDGQGSTVRDPLLAEAADPPLDLMVPSLHNQDTLAVASDHYLRSIITNGRDGTTMLAWGTAEGIGLLPDEVDRVVDYIRSWQSGEVTESMAAAAKGDAEVGTFTFWRNCSACHGMLGQGGIGTSLNSPGFLAAASDEFLAATIIEGRENTAMPSWRELDEQQVSDLIAYIRRWQKTKNQKNLSLSLVDKPDSFRVSKKIGKILYNANCALCHGGDGTGDLGISISSPEFLTLVDDRYLYETLARGRPGTGMPAWRHLSDEDMASLIKYLRSWQRQPSVKLASSRVQGDPWSGSTLFFDNCSKCHGEAAEGGVGPQLNNPVFLELVTDAMLTRWIANGKVSTGMIGFAKAEQGVNELTPRQIGDIVSYLRTLEGKERVSVKRSPHGVPQLGKIWFTESCSQCHGEAGEGSSGPALSNRAFLKNASDGFLMATMAMGRDGTEMRPVKKSPQSILDLTGDQINDIVAYLRSLEYERPAGDTPHRFVIPWDLGRGRVLYLANCSGCHGVNGKAEIVDTKLSAWAPELNNEGFLAAATDGFLQATIVLGRTGTAMRAFGKGHNGLVDLTMDEIDDLVAYIRHWSTLAPSPMTLPALRSIAESEETGEAQVGN